MESPAAELRGGGGGSAAWLLDLHPASFVRDFPPEKLPQLWHKVHGEAERLFGAESELVSDKQDEEVSHLITQAEAVCGLVRQYAITGARQSDSITAACAVMQSALRSLYHRPLLQEHIGDALCTLVERGAATAEELMRSSAAGSGHLLMWAVWQATQPPVLAHAVRRLWILRQGFQLIAWEQPGVEVFLTYTGDLPSVEFFYHDHSVALARILFSQCSALTETLHRRLFCIIMRAERQADRDQLVNMLAEVWAGLEGIHREVFEHEVVRVYVNCAVGAIPSMFPEFRAVLQRFASYSGPGKRVLLQGFRHQMRNSDLFAAIDAPNAIMRANAVTLLGDHFPLSTDGDRQDQEREWIDQLQTVQGALKDPCPLVRGKAASAACRMVARRCDFLPGHAYLPVLEYIFATLAYDASDSSVRLECIKSIRKDLLEQPLLHEALIPLLKKLKHLNDGNPRVRQAYSGLLVDLLPLKFVPISEVVSERAIIARMGIERSKPVLETLARLIRPSLWVERATREMDGAQYVRQLQAMVSAAPAAAVRFYGSIAQSRDHPAPVAGLIAACVRWIMAAPVGKHARLAEHMLVTLHEMVRGLAPRVADRKSRRVRERLAEVFSDEVLQRIEQRFTSPVARSLVIAVRTQVRLDGGQGDQSAAARDTLLQALRTQEITSASAEWRLVVERCVQEGIIDDVLGVACGWLGGDDTNEHRKAARVVAELLHSAKARRGVATSESWRLVQVGLQRLMEQAVERLRTQQSANAGVAEVLEALNHATLWCGLHGRSAQQKRAAARKTSRRAATAGSGSEDDSDSDEDEGAGSDEGSDCCPANVRSHAEWLRDTLLPVTRQISEAARAAADGEDEQHLDGDARLAAVALTEQAVVFFTHVASCGLLPRPTAPEQDNAEQAQAGEDAAPPPAEQPEQAPPQPREQLRIGASLHGVAAAEPQLLPRVFECVQAAAEMSVADALFGDFDSPGALCASVVRAAAARADQRRVVDEDTTIVDAETLRAEVWFHLGENGLRPRQLAHIGGALLISPLSARCFFDNLWQFSHERSGRTVMSYVIAELAGRHRDYCTWMLDAVANLVSRRGDAAVGLSKVEIHLVSMVFACCLCAPVPPQNKSSRETNAGRVLASRLRAFKTRRMDPFFQLQQELDELPDMQHDDQQAPSDADDPISGAVQPLDLGGDDAVTEDDGDERQVERSVGAAEDAQLAPAASQPQLTQQAKLSFQHLAALLNELPWTVSQGEPTGASIARGEVADGESDPGSVGAQLKRSMERLMQASQQRAQSELKSQMRAESRAASKEKGVERTSPEAKRRRASKERPQVASKGTVTDPAPSQARAPSQKKAAPAPAPAAAPAPAPAKTTACQTSPPPPVGAKVQEAAAAAAGPVSQARETQTTPKRPRKHRRRNK